MKTSRASNGALVAVGAGLALIVLLILQSSLGSGLLGMKTETSTLTTTVTLQPPVTPAVYEWLYEAQVRDPAMLASLYAQNANVTWTGVPGLSGIYNGPGNIELLYGSTLGKDTSVVVNIANYSERVLGPSDTNVTFSLTINGTSSVLGSFLDKANVTQDWTYSVGEGQWQIVKENWNYTAYTQQFPTTDTTFPQWAVMKSGGNPNLVSEKSFEWHAGPYVAATIYAFLSGMTFVLVTKLLASNGRKKG